MSQRSIYNYTNDDIQHAIEIDHRIWWVGHYLPHDTFQCNAYLIEQGDQSVLIDPGGYLTFEHVYQKVKEVIPFSHIRYFICSHQDPDITGVLKTIDTIEDRHRDACVVTHWRAKELIKHYDLRMPFWEIEENNWSLNIGGRILQFILTPYLHFPGAFCTFDPLSGVMFTSDLFGGMTPHWDLVARDESYFEDIRPFHEHYMPSKEILLHGLLKLEKYPMKIIAPQHGSIIIGYLIQFITNKLKQTDCGLFALANDITDIRRLSFLNKALRDITQAVIIYRDFRDIVHAILAILRRMLPLLSIEFYAYTGEKDVLYFGQETRYRGVVSESPLFCKEIFRFSKQSWNTRYKDLYQKLQLTTKSVLDRGKIEEPCIMIPLFSPASESLLSIAILRLAHDIEVTYEIERVVEQISSTLGVAIDRESIFRMVEMERKKFYEQSIRDSLTGLYNRFYMEEMLKQFFYMQDRDNKHGIIVVLLDIDHFKQLNDTYGHAAGDVVIKKVGATLIENIRFSDLPVRYGGEEFALFLMGYSLSEGIVVAEKLRELVSLLTFEAPLHEGKITISAGVAQRKQHESFLDFIKRADMALYRAKNAGRNKVCSEEDTSYEK
ncbi:MAG TPA: diguanylate cyclase [Candidatus Brocadiaceae bacterium]